MYVVKHSQTRLCYCYYSVIGWCIDAQSDADGTGATDGIGTEYRPCRRAYMIRAITLAFLQIFRMECVAMILEKIRRHHVT